jgi:hypothetical protein
MLPLMQNKVPPEGTLRRCVHGLYSPSWVNGVNYYCQMCNPSRVIPGEQSVCLPRSSADPLDEIGRTYANKNSRVGCPACGSHCWCRIDEKQRSDVERLCADCGHHYRVRSRVPEVE